MEFELRRLGVCTRVRRGQLLSSAGGGVGGVAVAALGRLARSMAPGLACGARLARRSEARAASASAWKPSTERWVPSGRPCFAQRATERVKRRSKRSAVDEAYGVSVGEESGGPAGARKSRSQKRRRSRRRAGRAHQLAHRVDALEGAGHDQLDEHDGVDQGGVRHSRRSEGRCTRARSPSR